MPKVNRQATTTPKPAPEETNGTAWDMVDTLRVLLYGASGTGKTTLWATFPGPTLALLCSGGNKPGELRSINTPENRKKITPVVIQSIEQLQALLPDASQYATVVLDHISGFMDLVIKELLGLDDIPVSKARTAAKGESWSLVSQQQYGQVAVICKEILRGMLNLPGNIVIVGQERTFGGKDDGVDPEIIKPTVGVAVTPSVAGWLNPACDYVLQTFKRPVLVPVKTTLAGKEHTTYQRGRGVEYCLRTEPHDVYMTKFRVPLGTPLPQLIVNPTYEKLQKVIRGEKL